MNAKATVALLVAACLFGSLVPACDATNHFQIRQTVSDEDMRWDAAGWTGKLAGVKITRRVLNRSFGLSRRAIAALIDDRRLPDSHTASRFVEGCVHTTLGYFQVQIVASAGAQARSTLTAWANSGNSGATANTGAGGHAHFSNSGAGNRAHEAHNGAGGRAHWTSTGAGNRANQANSGAGGRAHQTNSGAGARAQWTSTGAGARANLAHSGAGGRAQWTSTGAGARANQANSGAGARGGTSHLGCARAATPLDAGKVLPLPEFSLDSAWMVGGVIYQFGNVDSLLVALGDPAVSTTIALVSAKWFQIGIGP